MALGNNLKRIKKDSLIPSKKEKPAITKSKVIAKAKLKAPISKVIASPKPRVKPAKKIKSVAKKIKVIAKPKKEIKVSKPVIISNEKKIKEALSKKTTKSAITNKPKENANLDENILLGGEEGATITAKLIPSRRKTVRKTKLIFEGSLSLMEAEAIKKCLITTFTDYDVIDIQLLNITHLDIIPIQLIKLFISFYPDKKVRVDSELPFDMKIIVDRAGFGDLMFKEEAA